MIMMKNKSQLLNQIVQQKLQIINFLLTPEYEYMLK